MEEKGIQTRLYYPPIHTQPSYETSGAFETAVSVAEKGIWLPAAAYVTQEMVQHVCAEIKAWLATQ